MEAAKVMATKKGRGSTLIEVATVMAIGAIIAAVALLDMIAVNTAVVKYTDANTINQ